jgi:nucleoside-diphosphate-sugar epimerase
MAKKIKVFITGGSGYLGVSLASILSKTFQVTLATRSPKRVILQNKNIRIVKTKYKKIELINNTKGHNTIIHLLGINSLSALKNKKKSIRVKKIFTKNIIYSCVKNDIKNLIYLSSYKVYKNYDKKSIYSELQSKEDKIIYSLSHLIAEKILLNSSDAKLNVKILRLSNVFGLSVFHKSTETFNNLVNNFCYQGLSSKSILIKSPNVIRNFLPLNILAQTINLIIRNKIKNSLKIINIGYKSFNLYEIALLIQKKIKKHFNKRIEIVKNKKILKRKFFLYKSLNYKIPYSKKVFLDEIGNILKILDKNEISFKQ